MASVAEASEAEVLLVVGRNTILIDEIFDKSIDFDFYKLAKNEKIILFAWDNWFEGEIKAEIEILKELAVQYKFDLNFNEANFLQDEYITERMKNLLKFHE